MEVCPAGQCSVGRVHPKSGMDDWLRNRGHAGLEGRVALEDRTVHWVARAEGVQQVCVGDHRSETVVLTGAPRAVGRTVLLQNGSGLGLVLPQLQAGSFLN